MTLSRRILYLFINPAKLFNFTKSNKAWIIPLLIILLMTSISSYLIVPELIIPDQINNVKTNTAMSEEQKTDTISFYNSAYHHFTSFLYEVFIKVMYYPILTLFITSLPLIFGGTKREFLYVFSAVLYTGIINSLGFLLDTVLKLYYGSLDIGLNLSLIFDSSRQIVNSYLSVINLFGIWQILLLTTLISIYFDYGKIKSFIIIFNSWILLKFISGYIRYLRLTINL